MWAAKQLRYEKYNWRGPMECQFKTKSGIEIFMVVNSEGQIKLEEKELTNGMTLRCPASFSVHYISEFK